jgi:predicted ArsR family transcriptional regulator
MGIGYKRLPRILGVHYATVRRKLKKLEHRNYWYRIARRDP